MILQGLLIEWAGLNDWDRRELLGALVALRESHNVPSERRQQWKQRVEALLTEKEKGNTPRDGKTGIPPSPPARQATPPSAPLFRTDFTVRPDSEIL